MTTTQTDIEKTLKRILARELKEWPEGAAVAYQSRFDSEIYFDDPYGDGINNCYFRSGISAVDPLSRVTRADWEAERAILASEQAQPLGDSEEFDQALWDKSEISAMQSLMPIVWELSDQYDSGNQLIKCQVESAFDYADAFMAERAKRISARKAGA